MSTPIYRHTSNTSQFAQAIRSNAHETLVPGYKGAMMVDGNAKSRDSLHQFNAILRATPESDVKARFQRAYQHCMITQSPQDLSDLLITLLQKRRVRGGEGLRRLFYVLLVDMFENYPDLREFILALVPYIPHLGYFGDYWHILREINTRNTTSAEEPSLTYRQTFHPLVTKMVHSFWSQVKQDVAQLKQGQDQISLAGKWFPREQSATGKDIYWYFPVYNKSSGKPTGYHRRTLFHYLAIFRAYPEYATEGIPTRNLSEILPGSSSCNRILSKTRKTHSFLTKHLQVVETYQSAKEWAEIDFQKVTARNFEKYRLAFKNLLNKKGHKDEERYPYDGDRILCAENYQKHMLSGNFDKGQLDPTELMKKIRSHHQASDQLELEEMWKALILQTARDVLRYYVQLNEKVNQKTSESSNTPNTPTPPDLDLEAFCALLESPDKAEEIRQHEVLQTTEALDLFFAHLKTLHNTQQRELLLAALRPHVKGVIPVMDVSGSMCCSATSTSTCMEICVALGILFTYVNPGPFQDLAISFTDIPFTFDFTGKTVKSRVEDVFRHVGYSTNIELMMDTYLQIAVSNQIPQDQLADIVIFSDGGFDNMMGQNSSRWATTVQNFERMFRQKGYHQMPQIYFCNLAARQTNFQATTDRKGVSQLNGYSPAMFQQILSGDRVLATQPSDPSDPSNSSNSSNSSPQKSTEDDFRGMVEDKYFYLFRFLMSQCESGLLGKYEFHPSEEVEELVKTTQERLERPLSAPPVLPTLNTNSSPSPPAPSPPAPSPPAPSPPAPAPTTDEPSTETSKSSAGGMWSYLGY